MIYTVECSFSDPAHEAEWNAFYSDDKLPALICVTGFYTSQRLRLISGNAPTYLAIHTINDAHVLSGEEYRKKGGGNFARWQSMITDWRRNVYDGMDFAPEIRDDQILVVGESEARRPHPGKSYLLTAVGLDRSPERSWMTIFEAGFTEMAAVAGLNIYVPMGPQLVSGGLRAGMA